MFLKQIVETKRAEIAALQPVIGEKERQQAKQMAPVRSFSQAIRKPGNAIIAEVKPASPSKGVIRNEVDPVLVAQSYEQGGARAISVLTDRTYFRGENESLTKVKQAVTIPVLRKDFILDESQIVESRLIGADVILLIVAILDREQCSRLCQTAHEYGLEVLVEVHDAEEIETAIACGADVIGINNRNLSTFETDLATTEQLRPLISVQKPVITESGIHSVTDVQRLQKCQVDGMLIGEFLMRQPDQRRAVEELLAGDLQ